MRTALSLGRNLRMTSLEGAVRSSSCLLIAANASAPPSWKAISPQGVLRSGEPSDPPRPVRESNSVPTKTATAADGQDLTPAASKMVGTPFQFEALGPA